MNISRIYCPYIKNDSFVLLKNSRFNYVKNVLRKQVHESIVIFDGLGTEYLASIKEIRKNSLLLKTEKKTL